MSDDHPPSPCIAICEMHPAWQLCRGCLRTLDEIAGWSEMPAADKAQVLVQVEQRMAELLAD